MEGGVDVQVFACFVGRPGKPAGYYSKTAMKMIDALFSQFDKHSDLIEVALTLRDIQRINQNGKIAAIIGIESGQAIEDKIDLLKAFYDLGVRIMTITWKSNNWADASQQKAIHNGLTEFGRSVIREMNRLGMMIDVSHASDKTTLDVLDISSDPVIASHSCARAICNHPRNLSDSLIKGISKLGGAICVNFYSLFLDKGFRAKSVSVSFEKIIDHICHIIKIGGIDSVGLGSDFDGMNFPPKGLEDVSKMPKITESLLKKGYLEEEISKIMGGNFLRVFGQVCGI